ncbi:MAG TPA: DMT family transporter [Polyangia bacterium]
MNRLFSRPRAELVLVGVTILWGSTFVVTKDAVQTIAPLPFLTIRFGAAALLLCALYGRRLRTAGRRAIVDGVVLGLLNSAGLVLQVFGQVYTTVAKSSFITSFNTPLTPLVGWLLYRSRPSGPQRVAVVVATLGLMLLTWPGAGAHFNRGDLLTVGCAVLYAITIVEIARRTPGQDAGLLTAIQVVTAALMFGACLIAARIAIALYAPAHLPEMLRLETRPLVLTHRLCAELAWMAVMCTVVTFAGQTWAMARMSATAAAVTFALEPVFATTMALALGGAAEWPGARGSVGALLVLLAVGISELRARAPRNGANGPGSTLPSGNS